MGSKRRVERIEPNSRQSNKSNKRFIVGCLTLMNVEFRTSLELFCSTQQWLCNTVNVGLCTTLKQNSLLESSEWCNFKMPDAGIKHEALSIGSWGLGLQT